MLIDPSDADLPAVASDLAGYLAGPPVDIWDYAIIDAIGTLQDPIPVVDGWELVTPNADELRMLLPLPSTAAHQDRPFDPDDYGELAMLRRVNRDAAPQRGSAVPWDFLESLDVGHPERLLWQPLIALSLYDTRSPDCMTTRSPACMATRSCACGRGTASNRADEPTRCLIPFHGLPTGRRTLSGS